MNDATPGILGKTPINISPTMSFSATNDYNGKQVVVNVTMPDHPLFPGIVVRQTDLTPSGTVINNYGEGTSRYQSNQNLIGEITSGGINGIWTGLVPSPKELSYTPASGGGTGISSGSSGSGGIGDFSLGGAGLSSGGK